jgi:hypothetical protein
MLQIAVITIPNTGNVVVGGNIGNFNITGNESYLCRESQCYGAIHSIRT